MFDLNQRMRPHLRMLKPYSSARSEFYGSADVWLDANESPFGEGLNRYPDPLQNALKERVSELKGVDASKIFIGNGSDEAIDLLIRCFCEPGKESILICPPTYGMYAVSAAIQNVEIEKVTLLPDFSLDMSGVKAAMKKAEVRLIFLCSPNNPTGTSIAASEISEICENFQGIVAVDEAYIDFAESESATLLLARFPNLVVLQTLSKAYGMAGLRLGFAFGSPEMVNLLNKVKPPYNISTPNQERALTLLAEQGRIRKEVAELRLRRLELARALAALPFVKEVYPSQANFLLTRFTDGPAVYKHLVDQRIVVRSRSAEIPNTLRITIGTAKEQDQLLEALHTFKTKEP